MKNILSIALLVSFIALFCAFTNTGTLSTTSNVGKEASFKIFTNGEGSAYETRTVQAVAETAALEQTTIQMLDESTGTLHGKHLILSSERSDFWIYFDVGGVISPQIQVSGYNTIPIEIANDDSDGAVATKFANELNTNYSTHFSASVTDDTATVDNVNVGYTPNANAGTSGATVTTVVNGVAGLKNRYFTFGVGTSKYLVYMDSNGDATDPAVTGYTSVKVTTAIGDSADDVAGKIATALGAVSGITATALSDVVTITDTSYVSSQNIADGKLSTGFTFATTLDGSPGVLNNKYFVFYSGGDSTGYYVWYNVDAGGTSPGLAGLTAVPVAISAADSDYSVASDTADAVDALTTMTASDSTNEVTITAISTGATTLPSLGTSGFSVHQLYDGLTADPVVVKEIPCNASTLAGVYSLSNTAIVTPPTLTLQISPSATGDIWFSTSTTLVPSTDLGAVVSATPASISAIRCRVVTSAPTASGTATVYLTNNQEE